MIDPAVVARIRSLFFGEHWKVGTIATELGVHAETVQGALSDRVGWPRIPRPTPLEPYEGFIQVTLQDHPRLVATRIHEMLRLRGYTGGVRPVRRLVATLRPRRREAFLELRTFPGEQAQVDWAHFGKVSVPGGQRALSCFVMTLSYSRALYLEFFFDQTQESFLRGHVRAFAHFGGVPRIVLYDNLRAAVRERLGRAVHFHPRLLELCAHYHFQPRPCAVRRGNEKGRVERAIRYVRDSFFAARTFTTLADFNRQAWLWRDEISAERPWVQDPRRRVAEVLAEEQGHLLSLPTHPFDTDLILSVVPRKTISIPFDGSRYSIPPTHVGHTLTVVASDTEVRILAGRDELVRHRRSFDRNGSITDPAHVEALLADKRRAAGSVPSARLRSAAPEIESFLEAAFARGESASSQVAQLLKILELYGPQDFRAAVVEAVRRETFRASSVAFIAHKRQREAGTPRLPPVDLSRRPDLAHLDVNPHPAEIYDELSSHLPQSNLADALVQIGLLATAAGLDDFVARMTKARLSPRHLLEEIARIEIEDKARRSLERRLERARLGRFKPMADFDWTWPKKIERTVLERAFTLDFIRENRNLVLLGSNGLGKTMIAKNIALAAIQAGHSVLFTTAAELIENLQGDLSRETFRRKVGRYASCRLLCIDEVGYLAYDAHAADLLYKIVDRRYERGSVLLTTNLAFRQWNTVFPNATSIATLLDKLTHHADVTVIDGDSYRVHESQKEAAERRKRP